MKQKKDNRKILLMIFILIALIILIFISLGFLGKIENKPKIPTGNIDIFDIIFESNDKSNKEETQTPSSYTPNEYTETIVGKRKIENDKDNNLSNKDNNSNDKDIEPNESYIEIRDKNTSFTENTPLNIFTNASYDVAEDKIAPLSENTYQFVIRNKGEKGIKYSLLIQEENKYKINMRYRLKLNGEYVVGDDNNYVTSNELNQYEINLAENTYDVYTLDWKWFESKNDTEIGSRDIQTNYTLNLKILASQIL